MTNTTFEVDKTKALYERPAVTAEDAETTGAVKAAVAESFSVAKVEGFLKSLASAKLRIRDFESVLAQGKLGVATREQYGKLSAGDQAQVREEYLASLEHVEVALRNKYFRLYAYY